MKVGVNSKFRLNNYKYNKNKGLMTRLVIPPTHANSTSCYTGYWSDRIKVEVLMY